MNKENDSYDNASLFRELLCTLHMVHNHKGSNDDQQKKMTIQVLEGTQRYLTRYLEKLRKGL